MSDPQSPLTPDQREMLRHELMRSLARLERSMKTTRRAARPVRLDQSSVGRLSRMDALQNQSLTRGLQEREQAQLAQLTEALQRLDEGSYGLCSGCQRPIELGRLLLFPETVTCATCMR